MASSSAEAGRASSADPAPRCLPTGWENAEVMAARPRATGRPVARPRSGAALDAEPGHAGLERRSLETQDLCGAAVTADAPTGLLEDGEDVLALHVLEAAPLGFRAGAGRRGQDLAKLEAPLRGED